MTDVNTPVTGDEELPAATGKPLNATQVRLLEKLILADYEALYSYLEAQVSAQKEAVKVALNAKYGTSPDDDHLQRFLNRMKAKAQALQEEVDRGLAELGYNTRRGYNPISLRLDASVSYFERTEFIREYSEACKRIDTKYYALRKTLDTSKHNALRKAAMAGLLQADVQGVLAQIPRAETILAQLTEGTALLEGGDGEEVR